MNKAEIRAHLERKILPFWMGMKDEIYGGFYGYMDHNLITDRTADKGCILHSRILWTFPRQRGYCKARNCGGTRNTPGSL